MSQSTEGTASVSCRRPVKVADVHNHTPELPCHLDSVVNVCSPSISSRTLMKPTGQGRIGWIHRAFKNVCVWGGFTVDVPLTQNHRSLLISWCVTFLSHLWSPPLSSLRLQSTRRLRSQHGRNNGRRTSTHTSINVQIHLSGTTGSSPQMIFGA